MVVSSDPAFPSSVARPPQYTATEDGQATAEGGSNPTRWRVVLRPPKADRRILSRQEEIPRFARDSEPHEIAAALRASQ